MSSTENKKYKLTISLNVLYHLGINLYSNVPAVLTELVANCWDANAEIVDVSISSKKGKIIITDDRDGMDDSEINSRFLNVGYDRRKTSNPVTKKKRHVMGRKGIGKLSAFAIAKSVEVHSIKNGKHGFIMKLDDIEAKIKATNAINHDTKERDYYPTPVNSKNIKIKKGTQLILTDLKKNIVSVEKFLKKRLARRFSIVGKSNKFTVKVNGDPITIIDRDYFKNLEFIWYFGKDSKIYATQSAKATHKTQLSDIIDPNHNYEIKGWLGTVFEQENIDDEENIIVLHSHGKLVQEDILKDIKEEKIYSYYLMGEIEADFLDDDNLDDIITSDRQRLKEDDPRYIALKEFITKILQEQIKPNWEKWRKEKGVDQIVKLNPIVGKWLEKLKGGHKKLASNLLGKINTYKIKDPSAKRELIKSTIIGFERLARSNDLNLLDKITETTDVEIIKEIFSSLSEIEAYEFYNITKGRLEVIKKFEGLLPHAKEKVLQEYLFKNLWLLNPAWERATDDTKKMEQTVSKIFRAKIKTLLPAEKAGRIDICYKSDTGEHHIIELKKYSSQVTNANLVTQVEKYLNAFEKAIKEKYPNEPYRKVRITCVIGQPPKPYSDFASIERHKKALEAYGATFITYDELIEDASASYLGYLKKEKEVSELVKIIEGLDKSNK